MRAVINFNAYDSVLITGDEMSLEKFSRRNILVYCYDDVQNVSEPSRCPVRRRSVLLTLSINQTIDFLIVCPVSPSAVHISFTICGNDPILSLIQKNRVHENNAA